MGSTEENPYAPPQAFLGEPIEPENTQAELRPVPYEDLEVYPGFWIRCKETVLQALKENQTFLTRVPLGEGYARPWQFLMISYLPGLLLVLLILVPLVALGLAGSAFSWKAEALPGGVMIGILVGGLVLSPALIFLGLLIAGAVDHCCLWIWGGTKAGVGLHQTIRADGYALGVFSLLQLPLQLLGLIPFIGILFSLVNLALAMAFMVFKGLALARMHRTDIWRGVCATFTPFILLCCCGFIAAVTIPALLAIRGH